MIKAEMQNVKVVNFLIKHSGTIPVDRDAGADAYAVAVERLRAGEIVGVYPEATISRSFELKEFKTGAARMALEADVPIIPLIVWGAQRMWTKDHPKNLGRKKIPVTVAVGPPIERRPRPSTEPAPRCASDEHAAAASAAGLPASGGRVLGAAPARRLGADDGRGEALEEAELAERARKRAERERRASR